MLPTDPHSKGDPHSRGEDRPGRVNMGPSKRGVADQAPPRCKERQLLEKSPQRLGNLEIPDGFRQIEVDMPVPGARRRASPHVFICLANRVSGSDLGAGDTMGMRQKALLPVADRHQRTELTTSGGSHQLTGGISTQQDVDLNQFRFSGLPETVPDRGPFVTAGHSSCPNIRPGSEPSPPSRLEPSPGHRPWRLQAVT